MRCWLIFGLIHVSLVILPLPGLAAEVKPINLERLNTAGDEDDPHVSSNGLRLYYTARADGKYVILESVRKAKNESWRPGKPQADITTLGDSRSVFVTPDDKYPQRLYFATNAKGQNFDIFFLIKQGPRADFTTMTALHFSTPRDELHPWLTADGQSLYFSRKDKDGWHIYWGNRSSNFAKVRQIDLPVDFHHATLTPDSKTMYLQGPLANDRWGLFRSTWSANQWSKPEELDSLNNPKGRIGDLSPSLSRDGKLLFFASDRPGGKGGLDLWYVSTEEIQKEEPAPIKAARDEQEAARQLKLAKMLAEDGKLELAKKHYREIVEKYPKTKSAEEAQRLLEREKE
jgi:hypothetical protein